METYASSSGSVMFIPRQIEKTVPKMAKRLSNDNQCHEDDEEDKLQS